MTVAAIAPAVLALRAEVNAACPHRDKRSDGIIGDAAHESRGSATDHNAWLFDLYRAIDVDKDLETRPGGLTAGAYAETIRQLGQAGDPRLAGGGYVIWNGKIASDASKWFWAKYTGANAHREHVHVSLSRNLAGCQSTAGWGIAPAPAASSRPSVAGSRSPGLLVDGKLGLASVRALQARLGVTVDGDLGPLTIKALQRLLGVTVDGLWRDQTTRALQARVGARVDGDFGPESIKALQRALNAGTL